VAINMLATTTPSRTLSLAPRAPALSFVILDTVVGSVLELAIHAIEGVRDRLSKLAR
jgi:hypothetical protein